MNNTVNDVLAFVKENDVKFVRLGFCDPLGFQKNISITPDDLPGAFEYGVSFDAAAIQGFKDDIKSDLLLFPDPSTLTVLPWRPGPGRVIRFYCDIKTPEGMIYSHDSRNILKRVVERSRTMGYICQIGSECEFYLFKTDENGEPTDQTLDKGGYLDISPIDKGENIRREICLCLMEMGIKPETSHHEQGPGQNEISFKFSDAVSSADNLLTFKSVVKAIAARNGLFASFMPKPIQNASGSGLHVNISLARNGMNIFKKESDEHSKAAESFIAGILEQTPGMTLFLNPLANSYDRFGKCEAPKYVSWSHQNRSQLIRIPAAANDKFRMELRSPDPSMNPYLGFALIISAGLDGIERGLPLPPGVDINLFKAPDDFTRNLRQLPEDINSAIAQTEKSTFVRSVVGEEYFNSYIELKKLEASKYNRAVNNNSREEYYREKYFTMI